MAAMNNDIEKMLHFVAERDAMLVHLATDGLGTSDDLLIQVVCSRNKAQLQELDTAYRAYPKNSSRKSLYDRIGSECR